jgi:hypothetical protein
MRRIALALALVLTGCSKLGSPASPVEVAVQPVKAEPVATSARAAAPRRRAGDAVEVEWRADWWPARILEVRGDRYRVRYDGYDASWDETVGEERVRDRRATAEPDPDPPEVDDDVLDP